MVTWADWAGAEPAEPARLEAALAGCGLRGMAEVDLRWGSREAALGERVALARAVYARGDVYLLDCPLESVDALVRP